MTKFFLQSEVCACNILAWKIQFSFLLLHVFLLRLIPFVLLFLLCYIVHGMSHIAVSFTHAQFLISDIFLFLDANKVVFLRRILNKLRGRSSESTQPQEPQSSSSSFISPKLIFKVLLVAGVAVVWQYYLK